MCRSALRLLRIVSAVLFPKNDLGEVRRKRPEGGELFLGREPIGCLIPCLKVIKSVGLHAVKDSRIVISVRLLVEFLRKDKDVIGCAVELYRFPRGSRIEGIDGRTFVGDGKAFIEIVQQFFHQLCGLPPLLLRGKPVKLCQKAQIGRRMKGVAAGKSLPVQAGRTSAEQGACQKHSRGEETRRDETRSLHLKDGQRRTELRRTGRHRCRVPHR